MQCNDFPLINIFSSNRARRWPLTSKQTQLMCGEILYSYYYIGIPYNSVKIVRSAGTRLCDCDIMTWRIIVYAQQSRFNRISTYIVPYCRPYSAYPLIVFGDVCEFNFDERWKKILIDLEDIIRGRRVPVGLGDFVWTCIVLQYSIVMMTRIYNVLKKKKIDSLYIRVITTRHIN